MNGAIILFEKILTLFFGNIFCKFLKIYRSAKESLIELEKNDTEEDDSIIEETENVEDNEEKHKDANSVHKLEPSTTSLSITEKIPFITSASVI